MGCSRTADLTGLRCPMPIVKLNRLVEEMADGDDLIAIANDPAFSPDVEAWCNLTGNQLLRVAQDGKTLTATIRKKIRGLP